MDVQSQPSLPAYSLAPDKMLERFRALEAAHPDLVEIRDIGDSAARANGQGGHDLWAVVLTDERVQGPKTVVGHLGAVHGSELVASTLLTEFAEQLVKGHGRDAQSTHLLRNREVHLLPMVNPDGVVAMRAMLAGDADGRYGRDNANGVNINRNFPAAWGGDGAGIDPFHGNYRGPIAASEPETRAVIDHFEAHRPQVLVDWHNYGRLNLHSWGETGAPGPDGHREFAERISKLNTYEARPGVGLYPTSGTTTDWAIADLGAVGLTIETGTEDFLTDAGYDLIRRENMPALFELASLAGRDPIAAARGPMVAGPGVYEPDAGGGRQLGAWITEARSGGQAIAGAELTYDPRSRPGTGIELPAADGAWDSPDEGVAFPLGRRRGPKDGLAYVRAQDADGNWGAPTAVWMRPPNPAPPTPSTPPR